MKTCLLRIVNKFIPDQSAFIAHMTSNQIARMLLKLNSRIDKMSHYRQQQLSLRKTHRQLPAIALAVEL
jgi:hypothetical protein